MVQDGRFYSFSGCEPARIDDIVFHTWINTLYAPNRTFLQSCGQDLNFSQWQALGQDSGSTVRMPLSVSEIVSLGTRVLADGQERATTP
jgi:hypothetical protein